NLEADAGTGGIALNNSGDLVVGNITSPPVDSLSVDGLQAQDAIVINNTNGSMTVQEDIHTTANDIALTVADAAAPTPVHDYAFSRRSHAITADTGSVTITSGDDVNIGFGTTVQAAGAVLIGGDWAPPASDTDGE